jgi:hypothetical protein
MPKPHKHAELIKAWADGVEIQFKNPCRGVRGEVEPQWTDWKSDSSPAWLEHIEYRMKPVPHKWRKEMDAFAAGKKIQYRNTRAMTSTGREWIDLNFPKWSIKEGDEYRIKPETSERYACIGLTYWGRWSNTKKPADNLKLTFEGDTLISAEVLK